MKRELKSKLSILAMLVVLLIVQLIGINLKSGIKEVKREEQVDKIRNIELESITIYPNAKILTTLPKSEETTVEIKSTEDETINETTLIIEEDTTIVETEVEDETTLIIEEDTTIVETEIEDETTYYDEVAAVFVEEEEIETQGFTEVDFRELRYMASIIYAEAGDQCYAGQCAVGIVVMNRIKSDEFPNNLYDVLYQRGQFTPASNGRLDNALYLYDIGEIPDSCIEAAIYALGGNTIVEYYGESIDMYNYHFFSMYLSECRFIIQDHMFK